jgi:phage terminase large subunit-like protein
LIDSNGNPTPFQPDQWQAEDFAALDPAWLELAGFEIPDKKGEPIRRGFFERGRGHSKTGDLSCMSAWAIAYACRPIRGIAAAADKDQAALLLDGISRLVHLNPSLQMLDVQSWRVVNRETGSQLDIMSSDVPTSYGQLPDFVVCDEVGHWPENRGEELWGSLFSAAAKRSHCLLVGITNAGFQESWTWRVREMIRTDPAWHFSRLDGPRASWISTELLAEQQRILPPQVFSRLWLNVWSSGLGDALQARDIDAALTLKGPTPFRENGCRYWAGLDLGISSDHSALVLVGKHTTGRLKLAQCLSWKPPPGGKVDLTIIEHACLDLHQRFACKFMVDPYQAQMLMQRLAQKGVRIEEVPFVGANLCAMASSLIGAFSTQALDLYDEPELIADLRRLRIKESPSGWRLDAPRTASGHCDRATGLSLALYGARQAPLQRQSREMPWSCGRFKGLADLEDLAPEYAAQFTSNVPRDRLTGERLWACDDIDSLRTTRIWPR